jgi:hypothetical protein
MSSMLRCECFEGVVATRRDASIRVAMRGLSPLMVGLTSALALAPIGAGANTLIVNNCLDDSSVGSLRYQVAHAISGDVIDLSTNQLACSTITLTNGAIREAADLLTFQGPSDRVFTITSGGAPAPHRRIFEAIRLGLTDIELRIYNLTISGGYYYGGSTHAFGGCIYGSGARVKLTDATVSGCNARMYDSNAGEHGAYGGGVFADSVTLTRSRVTGNVAYSLKKAYGGGVWARNMASIYDSTISTNTAISELEKAAGGGVYTPSLYMRGSTVDANRANSQGAVGGGIWVQSTDIVQSTISGNSATFAGGGMYVNGFFDVRNSTIAFNSAMQSTGVYAKGSGSFTARSSVIARNILSGPSGFADVFIAGHALGGANNLVMSYNLASAAITVTSDPQLAPLAFHGGLTRTHALLSTSPAIDQGDNTVLPLLTDQRGAGFAREVPTGKPDVGAYERQVDDDEVFSGGFD